MRTKIALLAAAAIATVSGVASAASIFPPVVETDLSLSYQPPCSVCHSGSPGFGTATQPFAMALKARGLVPDDTNALTDALTKMTADKVDSDGNGTTDVDQLKAGCDPNTDAPINTGATCGSSGGDGGVVGDFAPPPTYGCGAQIAAGPIAAGPAAFGFAALLALALGRRRRGR